MLYLVPLAIIAVGVIMFWLDQDFETPVLFFLGCGVALYGVWRLFGVILSPQCYDGTIKGAALIAACY